MKRKLRFLCPELKLRDVKGIGGLLEAQVERFEAWGPLLAEIPAGELETSLSLVHWRFFSDPTPHGMPVVPFCVLDRDEGLELNRSMNVFQSLTTLWDHPNFLGMYQGGLSLASIRTLLWGLSQLFHNNFDAPDLCPWGSSQQSLQENPLSPGDPLYLPLLMLSTLSANSPPAWDAPVPETILPSEGLRFHNGFQEGVSGVWKLPSLNGTSARPLIQELSRRLRRGEGALFLWNPSCEQLRASFWGQPQGLGAAGAHLDFLDPPLTLFLRLPRAL